VIVIKWLLIVLILVGIFFAWSVIVMLLVRRFGIRMPWHWPFGIRRKKTAIELKTLSCLQYVVVEGVLTWGMAVGFMLSAKDLLAFRLGLHKPLTWSDFALNILIFSVAGIWYGYSMWDNLWKSAPGEIGSSTQNSS